MELRILIKKLISKLSVAEEKIFSDWYNASAKHRKYFLNVKKTYEGKTESVDTEMAWLKMQQQLQANQKKINFRRLAIAASIIGIIGIGYLVQQKVTHNSIPQEVVETNVIEKGSDKATLTLENGEEIEMTKGKAYATAHAQSNGEELVYQKKSKKNTKIQYNILTVPRGGQFHIVLADGTTVWLNSASQLKYPVSFLEDQPRKVELVYGEAYFDVTPAAANNNTSFIVANQSQNVTVLGTEFNIKAYAEEADVYTTLVEGKVTVDVDGTSHQLIPGQQSKLDIAKQSVAIAAVNIKNEISWKDGIFSFRRKPLGEIMQVLSRWYDVDIYFEDETLKANGFNGVISKNQEITEILNSLQNFGTIKSYEIKEKTIVLK